MKFNIAYPTNGTQVTREIRSKDEQKFYGRKIGEQFDGKIISDEFEGCIMQITGGNDYQGVSMIANKDTTKRIRVLLSKGDVGYRCTRRGVRERKTVRGSIISGETQVVALIMVRVPEGKEISGLTDTIKDKTHLPKNIHKLRATFGIPEDADPVEFVHNLIKSQNPNAELPKIKVTGVVSEEAKKRKATELAERKARKEKFLLEKKEFETKYGLKL